MLYTEMKNKLIVLYLLPELRRTIKLNKTKSYLITRQVITIFRTKGKHGLVREGHMLDIDFSSLARAIRFHDQGKYFFLVDFGIIKIT